MKYFPLFALAVFLSVGSHAQEFRISEHKEQLWFQYFNQTRINEKWSVWLDGGIRTEDSFIKGVSTVLGRVGMIYNVNRNLRVAGGYAYFVQYPPYEIDGIGQPEHRFWQQVQWQKNKPRGQFVHGIRFEQRFRHRMASFSELGDGYRFNYRIRYNFTWQYPLTKHRLEKGDLSLVVTDEIMFNFGKQVIYDHFDQNRILLGLRYYFDRNNNLLIGYMNIYQKLPAPQLVRISNDIRISYFQTLHL